MDKIQIEATEINIESKLLKQITKQQVFGIAQQDKIDYKLTMQWRDFGLMKPVMKIPQSLKLQLIKVPIYIYKI